MQGGSGRGRGVDVPIGWMEGGDARWRSRREREMAAEVKNVAVTIHNLEWLPSWACIGLAAFSVQHSARLGLQTAGNSCALLVEGEGRLVCASGCMYVFPYSLLKIHSS
jgi:hypothetical protein